MFENAGRLYLFNLASEKYHEVKIQAFDRPATLKPRIEDVSRPSATRRFAVGANESPSRRAGDIFTVPASTLVVREPTRTSASQPALPACVARRQSCWLIQDRTGTERPAH